MDEIDVAPYTKQSVDKAKLPPSVIPEVEDNVGHAVEHFSVTLDAEDSFDNAVKQLGVTPDSTDSQAEKEVVQHDSPILMDEPSIMDIATQQQQTPPSERDEWHDDGDHGVDVIPDLVEPPE